MQIAHDRQKSYADLKRKPMEFQVGDKVLEKVGSVAYKLELPEELIRVHNTFHVSNLKKCYANEQLAVPLDGLHFDDKIQFVEEPVEIMDREVKQLRRSRVPIVKFQWNSRRGPEFTWEREDQFRKKYPHLFIKTAPSSNTVMSDYEDSTVRYTIVSSPFADLPDIGSPGVDGPLVMPEDPYAYVVAAFQALLFLDYVLGPEYPPSPKFVPEPVYPEFMPPKDEILLAKEQPLPAAVLPTADLPGYVPEEDPKEDPEEDDNEDPEKDPADGGDDGNDEDELSNDDEDEDAPSAEETEPFETDDLSYIPQDTFSTITPDTFTLYQSPPLPQISSPPLPVSSPVPVLSSSPPASPIRLLGYRAVMIWLRAEAASTSHSLPLPPPIILSYTRSDASLSGKPPLLPIPLPTSSPPLHLLYTDRRADRPKVTLPPRKRLGIALGLRYKVGESSSAAARPPGGLRADYGFVATMDREITRDLERDVSYGIIETGDEMLVDMPGAPATDDIELGRRMTEFTTRVRQDTNKIYTRLDDEQSERQLMASQLNMLYRDRRTYARLLGSWRLRPGCLERLGDDP
ncbi:hypothetical protein Tco_1101990 [Tanacetum coccineum]